jgi:diacylglycerol kinase (ATP)
MSRRILYLINPISGTKGKSAFTELVRKKTRERQLDFDLLATSADGSYEHLKKKIITESVSDVVICGGDGTASAVLAALSGIRVNIGIIPMGSGNGLAFAAKIPRQPTRALDVIFQGKSAAVDAFTINDRFSCMLCGIGFDALVAREFAKEKTRGLSAYVRTTAVNFLKASPYHFQINMKGKTMQTEAFFISIANSNQFGNNFTIAPQASLSDGLLDIVIVKKMSKFKLPFSVISQVTGINGIQQASDYAPGKDIIYFQTDKLDILNPELAPLHIDGDPADTAPELKIRILKNCFMLLQP